MESVTEKRKTVHSLIWQLPVLLAHVTTAMTGETHFTVSLDPSKRLGKGAPITYCTDGHLGTGPVPDSGVL